MSESSRIKEVPPVLHISAFMHGHGYLELAKNLKEKIPKTVDETFEGSELSFEEKWPRARQNWPVPHSEIKETLVRLTDEPIILERMIEGHQVRRIHVDSRSSSEIILGKELMLPKKERGEGDMGENVTICNKRLDQSIMIGSTLSPGCKQRLINILQKNVDVLAWAGSEWTTVPRFVMEHQLKTYLLAESVVHKKRPLTPDKRQALKEKLASDAWQVQMDYSGLNRICAKDMYPFSKVEDELASLMGYLYKCFLRLPKESSEVRMVEDDEEKTRFHTEEGVCCFTHMLKGVENSAITLERMMEKVLVDQKGWNVKVHLKEIVKKKKGRAELN
nr:hypothetical protein [Tanacetum cinerariifolium]